MILKKRNFLKMMALELEDMRYKIELDIQATEKTLCEEDISPNVFRENLALLRNKLMAVRCFEQLLAAARPEDYASLDELAEQVKRCSVEQIECRGLVYSAGLAVERKIEKAKRYILQED